MIALLTSLFATFLFLIAVACLVRDLMDLRAIRQRGRPKLPPMEEEYGEEGFSILPPSARFANRPDVKWSTIEELIQ